MHVRREHLDPTLTSGEKTEMSINAASIEYYRDSSATSDRQKFGSGWLTYLLLRHW